MGSTNVFEVPQDILDTARLTMADLRVELAISRGDPTVWPVVPSVRVVHIPDPSCQNF
jgi:hypothetical protein